MIAMITICLFITLMNGFIIIFLTQHRTKMQFQNLAVFAIDTYQWQKETFVDSSTKSILLHLLHEMHELLDECKKSDGKMTDDMRLEFADAMILLVGAWQEAGGDPYDLMQAMVDKMKINRARKWSEPNEDGVVFHIKEGNE